MNNGFYEFSRPQITSSVFPYTGSATISGSLTVIGSAVATSFTGSLFGTSSFAVSSSRAVTSSFAISASWAPTQNIDTSSLVTTSSFNAFTSSYNTGSFTGSFTGTLIGTSSWATNSITASYITSSNVHGPFGANSILSASYSNFAATASSALNAEDILIYVKNVSGAQIDKGKVVRISGATGDNPLISTASYEADGLSANTLGITNQNIPNDSFGYVITEGRLLGIDTDSFTAGQLIYLGSTGSIIGTAPVAPLHSVRIGEVLRVQQNNGSIYVRIDNGYELGELHDVVDTTTTSSYGDLLVKSGSVWTNSRQLTGSYGLTGSLNATSFTGSLFGTSSWAQSASVAPNYLPLTGGTIAGSLTINNNLTVLGSASIQYISESVLNIGTNLITVNIFDPAVRFGGLAIIDSGSSPQVSASFLYDSVEDEFIFVHKGTSTSAITSSHFVLGPETYNNLGNETYLTANRIPKGVGNEHLNDSNISDNGSVVSINSNSEITGSLRVTQGITGSLFGTSSWSNNATTASYILNAVSSSFATTASYIQNAESASYVLQAVSSSFATTTSYAVNGGVTQIVAGTNVTISPTNGLGTVTINSTGGGGSGGTDLGLVQAMTVGLQNIF